MKLDDIDILISHRTAWQKAKNELQNVRNNACVHAHFGGNTYVNDPVIMKKVKELVLTEVTAKYELAITKMMQLGITEFPE